MIFRARLKPGHVQPVWAGHPWVFAQAVELQKSGLSAGQEVLIEDAAGRPLGRGLYSPGSALCIRRFTTDPAQPLDEGFIAGRLLRALELRSTLGLPSAETNAFRLCFGEGDELPGVIVDVYGDTAVVQFATVGMAQRRSMVVSALNSAIAPRAILERTDPQAARREGFEHFAGCLSGDSDGSLTFLERGLKLRLGVELGQKTGYYLDQRPLRARIEALARGRRVLDLYSYVGASSLAAARGGATRVLAVDSSQVALDTAAELASLNTLPFETLRGDARKVLEELDASFDMILLDPPKLSPRRGSRGSAERELRALTRLAIGRLAPGGLLVASSCSNAVGIQALTRAIALGSRDAGRSATVLERVFQGPDHPVPAAFPEGLYLSSVIVLT